MKRTGYDDEFADYFTARAAVLRRLAYGLCGNWHTAEDLVQGTFVRLYRAWPRVRVDSVDAYARRILVNLFLSKRRTRRWELVTDVPPDHAAPAGTDPADKVAVRAALGGLAPRQRAVVVLRYLEDLPVAEVAAVLGISAGTVKSQSARGLDALRASLNLLGRDHAGH